MWGKKLSARSNKTKVVLTDAGMGCIAFRVAPVKEGVRLILAHEGKATGARPVKKRPGAFYTGILLEGFKKRGGISIDGWLRPPPDEGDAHPDFRTLVQADGDIVCKVNTALFSETNWKELLRSYARVRNQFLEEFAGRFRALVRKVLVAGGTGISILAIIKMIVSWSFQ